MSTGVYQSAFSFMLVHLDVLSLRPQTNTTSALLAAARLVSGLRPSRWGPSGWTISCVHLENVIVQKFMEYGSTVASSGEEFVYCWENPFRFLQRFTRIMLDSCNFTGENLCKNGFSDSHWNSPPERPLFVPNWAALNKICQNFLFI